MTILFLLVALALIMGFSPIVSYILYLSWNSSIASMGLVTDINFGQSFALFWLIVCISIPFSLSSGNSRD